MYLSVKEKLFQMYLSEEPFQEEGYFGEKLVILLVFVCLNIISFYIFPSVNMLAE